MKVGRSSDNDVVIHDTSISWSHAEFQLHDSGALWLKDLESKNGTWLSGRPINSEVLVQKGDLIMLAKSVEVLIEDNPSSSLLEATWRESLERLSKQVRSMNASSVSESA